MATLSFRDSHVKPARTLRLLQPVTDTPGALLICARGETATYLVERRPADFGLAFRVTKQELVPQDPGDWELRDTAAYDVCLDGPRSLCGCRAFLRWGMGKDGKGCRHIAALQTLRDRNLL
jgi:hypothetical protein